MGMGGTGTWTRRRRAAARLLAGCVAAMAGAMAATAGAATVEAADTIIHAGTLIDGATATPHRQMSIVLHGDHIIAVESGFIRRPGVPVIDLSHQTVLPGLIDCHIHISAPLPGRSNAVEDMVTRTPLDLAFRAAAYARALLLQGFTSARDVGGGDETVALRDAIAAGRTAGPRLLVSLEPLGPTAGHGDPANGLDPALSHPGWKNGIVDTPEEGRYRVREHRRRGADLIKIMPSGGIASTGDNPRQQLMTDEEIKAVIDSAHALGMKVAAHTYPSGAIRAAVLAGVDSIEHGSFIDADTARLMKQHDTYLVPTLTVYDVFMQTARQHPELLPPGTAAKELANDALPKANLPVPYKVGVKIAYGTDIGEGDHAREFVLLREAGVSAADALLAATGTAADLLGTADHAGRVLPGHDADLIAVNGNPLEDLSLMQRVDFVMKGGVVYKSGGQPTLAIAGTLSGK